MTIAGHNEIYRWENPVWPFLVHKLLGPRTPPPPLLLLPWGPNPSEGAPASLVSSEHGTSVWPPLPQTARRARAKPPP